jgi:CheY-like chemotaxis protein
MPARILVVDRNQAFAIMLKEMLEKDAGYQAEVANKGSEALALLRRAGFDLTIIDMDLDSTDMGYRDLILRVRELHPTMRLILIPLMGEGLPAEALQLDIQGALSKPFFADDLLRSIKETLAARVYPKPLSFSTPPSSALPSSALPSAALPSAAPPSAAKPAPRAASELQATLRELARETNAEAVLLIALTRGERKIVASASSLDGARLRRLADLSIDAIQAAQAAAPLLDQPNRPFEHNMFESDSVRLYALALPEDLLLIVAGPASTPLGTIRHNLRRAARDVTRLAGG